MAGARQHGGIERIAERLRAEAAQQRLSIELRARNKFH